MTVTVTKTVGTGGRDYSTIQSAADGLPANIVTIDEAWVFECYNDGEFSSAGQILLGADNAGANAGPNTVTFKCAAGHSFKDNMVAGDPLRIDPARGVTWTRTANGTVVGRNGIGNWIFEDLQIRGQSSSHIFQNDSTGSAPTIRGCILEGTCSGNYSQVVNIGGDGEVYNTLIINRGTGNGITLFDGPDTIVNLTIVCTNASNTRYGIARSYSSDVTAINIAVFGFANFTQIPASGFTASTDYLATDKATAIGSGTHNLTSLAYADQFENTTDASRDFRLKSGSALRDAGVAHAETPNDILGTLRDATPDIGAWEYVAAGGTTVTVGLAGETSTALGVSVAKSKAVGQAAETDSAPAASARRTLLAGIATETDSALAAGHAKRRGVGIAGETGTALAAGALKTRAAGLAGETDGAPGVTAAKAKAVGLAGEIDSAPGVTAQLGGQIGIAVEADTALTAIAAKRRAIGAGAETDSAPAAAVGKRRAVGLAAETSLALAASVAKRVAAGSAIEIDLAQAIAAAKRRTIGLALESDSALAVSLDAPLPLSGGMVRRAAGLAAVRRAAGSVIRRA